MSGVRVPASAPIVRLPGEGEPLRLGATSARQLVSGGDLAGRMALAETTLAPGFPGPVPHRHREMHDVFYVLEGLVRFCLPEGERDLGPGSFVAVPPGVVHTFSNPHDAPARLLNIFLPAGLEGYLRELVALGGPPDPATMARVASRYDFEAVPDGVSP